jgi:hypothetical protein
MPEPAYAQYLIPLLPPLVPRFALALDELRGRPRDAILVLTAISSIVGISYTAHLSIRAWRRGSELVAAVQQGHEAAVLAAGTPVVTLSPEVVAGSDVELDRRFVTGPFLYRTFGPLSLDAQRYGYSPSWQRVGDALDAEQPGAIMVGGEKHPYPLHANGLDGELVSWATAHRYKAVPLRKPGFTLFIRR